MTTDRELLELAAKAAGIEIRPFRGFIHHEGQQPEYFERKMPFGHMVWNPLTDDGDALRLAVKLKIDINYFEGYQQVLASTHCCTHEEFIDYTDDRAKDVRLAIVTVAAAAGKAMP